MTQQDDQQMRWASIDTLAVLALTLVAGLLRFVRLTTVDFLHGDERFYVNDACWYLFSSAESCVVDTESNLEHPPLGKWIIAAGMKVFGDNPWGHRVLPALLGTLTIPLAYLLARKLLRSRLGAVVVAGLLAVDFMHFVLSRAAMLDIPLTFFAVISLLCMAYARERPEGTDRWLRCAAGAAAGAAIASKWTGVTILGTIAFLALAWDILARRGPEERHPVVRAIRERGMSWVLAFVLIPAVVYSLTFVGRVHGDVLALPWNEGSWWHALAERQLTTFRFHAHHIWSHRLASEPWSWPLTKRGFPMAGRVEPDGSGQLVIATGNPVVWTLGVLAVFYVAVRWIRQRTRRSVEGFITAGFVLTYLPWFLYFYAPWIFFTWGRVATFVFYFLPVLPFVYLGLGYIASRSERSRGGRVGVAIGLAAAAAAFAFYYPLLTYVPLDRAAVQARLFAFDDCAAPKGDPFVFLTPTTDANGDTVYERKSAPTSDFLPPDGWCWI